MPFKGDKRLGLSTVKAKPMTVFNVKLKHSKVSKKLLEDHESIRAILKQLQKALQEICRRQSPAELEKAKESITNLVQIMSIHAACEERFVFPALSDEYPILALEAEHDEALLQRAALMSGIMNYSFPEDCTDALYNKNMEFMDLLQRHLQKEETVIFPLIELLSDTEQTRILEQMDKIRI